MIYSLVGSLLRPSRKFCIIWRTVASQGVDKPQRFDVARIREEIFQNWLIAESKTSRGVTTRSRYCCFTHEDAVRAYKDHKASWHWLDGELSSNMAGETGAVFIYKGAQSAIKLRPDITNDSEVMDFVMEHMENEQAHLDLFGSVLPDGKYTRLVPLWRVAGWTLGFIPTLLGGSRALYVTVEAVETFVEEHYQQQIVPLKKQGVSPELVRLLEHCCEDEVHHKEDAARKLLGDSSSIHKSLNSWWATPWAWIVKAGSTVAADVARRV